MLDLQKLAGKRSAAPCRKKEDESGRRRVGTPLSVTFWTAREHGDLLPARFSDARRDQVDVYGGKRTGTGCSYLDASPYSR